MLLVFFVDRKVDLSILHNICIWSFNEIMKASLTIGQNFEAKNLKS